MLTTQIRKHFKIEHDCPLAGYYETTRLNELEKDIETALFSGKLISVTGSVGTGKTTLINRLQNKLNKNGKAIVSRSLSVDKNRVSLPSLLTALFLDISGKLDFKIPRAENRERTLLELVKCNELHLSDF